MARINPWLTNGGISIPGWLLVRSEVTPGAKILYAVLAEEADDETGVFRPSSEHYLGDAAFGCFLELKGHGLIGYATEPVKGEEKDYYFIGHPWMLNAVEEGVAS